LLGVIQHAPQLGGLAPFDFSSGQAFNAERLADESLGFRAIPPAPEAIAV
jgi:hypothetical protein